MTSGSSQRRAHLVFALGLLLSGVGTFARAQDNAQQPDNTKVNERDRDKSQPTADQQSNDRSDLEITQQIRQSIMKDKTLSTYAHNVKIITEGGVVTLKGPVSSEEERSSIQTKAAAIVGADKVTNELAVKSKK